MLCLLPLLSCIILSCIVSSLFVLFAPTICFSTSFTRTSQVGQVAHVYYCRYHILFVACEVVRVFSCFASQPSRRHYRSPLPFMTTNEKQARLEDSTSKLNQALMDSTMQHDDAQWRSHPSLLGAGPREEVRVMRWGNPPKQYCWIACFYT